LTDIIARVNGHTGYYLELLHKKDVNTTYIEQIELVHTLSEAAISGALRVA
jgi:hypothetical protein